MAKVKVTLIHSVAHRKPTQRRTVKALGPMSCQTTRQRVVQSLRLLTWFPLKKSSN
mgnify:CR=1 FL=1